MKKKIESLEAEIRFLSGLDAELERLSFENLRKLSAARLALAGIYCPFHKGESVRLKVSYRGTDMGVVDGILPPGPGAEADCKYCLIVRPVLDGWTLSPVDYSLHPQILGSNREFEDLNGKQAFVLDGL